MVRADLYKHGLGKLLLIERLKQAYNDFGETIVKIDTSQHSCGFFEKCGFKINSITNDFFALGLHKVEMELLLNKESVMLLVEANS
jgi:predicted GNAT family N-acyltransferase